MTLIPYERASFSRRERGWLAAILALVAALTVIDVVEDWLEGASLGHIIPEVFIVLCLTGALTYLLAALVRNRQLALNRAEEELSRAKETATTWRSRAESLSQGVTDAISAQFIEWGLSPAEQEVGFLLLKGLSIQEIASVRGTSERTVRQQASEVYKKSGLSGRAQLSAFFLEDLFQVAER